MVSYHNSRSAARSQKSYSYATVSALLVATTCLSTLPTTAFAQAEDPAAEETIIVTGSRREARSVADLPAPVDIFSAEDLSRQGSPDVANLLRQIVPSLNVNDNTISGTASGIRPVTLRGLSPDHTLVLVNGKRQHRASDIPTFSGGISDGAQGPDMASIPAIALKQVQVLRDGAAAQYGSDAIAGVVNFIMSDAPEGGTIQAKIGSTYKGDGDSYQVAATWGTRLGENGFVRFSGEYSDTDMTTRAVQRGDAQALIDAGFEDVPTPATRFGSPAFKDDIKTFVNMAVENGLGGEFYAFGGYAQRTVYNDFFYRNAADRQGVFTDGAGNYLVGDMTPDDGVTCDGGIDFGGTGVVNDPIGVNDPDALARLAAASANPNCFVAQNVHPGGYTPLFGNKIKDIYGSLGMRGDITDKLSYDVSFGAGRHSMHIFVGNSLNPSLGTGSPVDFKNNGKRHQSEMVFNADLNYAADVGFHSPLNIAGGFQWHREQFEVIAGDPETYLAGVLATQGFLVGEESYPGYSPAIAGTFSRRNISAYLDLEANVTEALVLGTAVRFEDFSDFGSKVTYKLSGLYNITEDFGIRGTYATGFHAPTPGQQNYSGLTTELTTDGRLIQSGIIPATNPAAVAVGGKPLKPETSKSFSLGFVYDAGWLSLTVDYFNIKMKDRLTQSASYALTDEQKAALVAAGYLSAVDLGSVRFFTNDFSSKTQGVDVVATMPLDFIPGGKTNFSLAGNWTETKVTSFDPTDPDELLSVTRVLQLEKNLPRYRGNASITHTADNWRALARVNYYGKYTEMHVNSGGLRIDAGSEITFDAELGYNITPAIELSVGAQNLLNNNPDINPYRFILGSKYPTTSPMGVNGGTYYARVQFQF